MASDRALVLILNWNGWRDTLECLESVFRSDYPSFQVAVCDNGSLDGSMEQIRAWAEGELQAGAPEGHALRRLSFPPIPKPIPFAQYDRARAEAGGELGSVPPPLTLIQTGANLGFAAGNNVGLRYALAVGRFEYVWLVNNDAVVEPEALRSLVEVLESRPEAGMCGSTLLEYSEPARVQALGGARYNRWLSTVRPIVAREPARTQREGRSVEARLSYVAGASMLVRRAFLEQIGLLCEEYFLYFEELDWAARARGKFSLAYAPASRVYHKEGRSTGASDRAGTKSAWADFYFQRNRRLFARKFHPFTLPCVYLGLGLSLLNRLRRGRWDQARALVRAVKSGRGASS